MAFTSFSTHVEPSRVQNDLLGSGEFHGPVLLAEADSASLSVEDITATEATATEGWAEVAAAIAAIAEVAAVVDDAPVVTFDLPAPALASASAPVTPLVTQAPEVVLPVAAAATEAPGTTAAAPLVWGAKVTPTFRQEVRAMCGRLGCQADHLMAAIAFESVETFSPAVKNPMSGATGLIQFMPETARMLGTNLDKLAELTAEEQLVYVEKYFQPFKGKIGTLEDIYMAILWPRAVGQPNDYVLFSSGTIQYTQNAGLDSDGDGVITKQETASIVMAMFRKGQRPQNLA